MILFSHFYHSVQRVVCRRCSRFFSNFFRQVRHEGQQKLAVLIIQLSFQIMCQCALETRIPAGTLVVKVGSPASSFPCGIDFYAILRSHEPDEGSLGQDLVAAYTGSLWNMFNSFS